jgi:hypothetical protein
MPFINECEPRSRFTLFFWRVTRIKATQDIIGTWSTPMGRVWQFGHTRFIVRRKSS